MRKAAYIKIMKLLGYVTTPKLQVSDVEIWDKDFSVKHGYLYFIKSKKNKNGKRKSTR